MERRRPETTPVVVAVWFPADPLLGAAVAANLAAVPGTPGVLVDLDADWGDAASVVLDDPAPTGSDDDLLEAAVRGAGGVLAVALRGLDAGVIAALRADGGGVVALPSRLDAAVVAAAADVLLLGVERSFPSLRRARLALDALPTAHGTTRVVLAEGRPSDLTRADVADVLQCHIAGDLPLGEREVAASLERGAVPAAAPRGPWARAVAALAGDIWPGAGAAEVRARPRLLELIGNWR